MQRRETQRMSATPPRSNPRTPAVPSRWPLASHGAPALPERTPARVPGAALRSSTGLLTRFARHPHSAVPVATPTHMLPVQVVERVEIARDVISVFLVLPGTRQAPAPYLPGQFVTLALPTGEDTLYRSYSLCGDGSLDRPWELTIKRVHDGAASTYFYEHVDRGTLLYASIPRGTFTLPANLSPEQVLTFVAVGSGITPIRGMLRAIAKLPPDERPLAQLFYAGRSRADLIYGDELLDLDPAGAWLRQVWYLSSEGARLTVDEVIGNTGRTALRSHWYVCGPDTLKRDLQAQLAALGLPAARYHAEVFATTSEPAPPLAMCAESNAGGTLYILQTGATLDVQPQETLLVALERHGYRPAFGCRAGACGACKLRVVAGEVDTPSEALSDADCREGYILSCIAHPIGPVTLESGGTPPNDVLLCGTRAGWGAATAGPKGPTARAVALAWLLALALIAAGTLASIGALAAFAPPLPPPSGAGYVHLHGEVVALRDNGFFAVHVPGQKEVLWLQPAPGARISLSHLRRHLREQAPTDIMYEVAPGGLLLAVSAD